MMVQRYQRQVSPQTGITNPGAGDDASYLAQQLEAFASRRQDQLDQETHYQATIAGELAGSEGVPDEQTNTTIAGRAFNRAAERAHQAALQTDIRESIAQYQIEHSDDPDAFDAKVAGLEQGLKDETEQRFLPFVQQRIADYSSTAKLRILDRQQTKMRQEAISDLQRGAKGLVDDANTAAFEGRIEGVEARRQELETLLSEGVESGLIEEGAAQDALNNFETGIISNEVVGSFALLLREQGTEAGRKSLKQWNKTKPSEIGLHVDDYTAITRQLRLRQSQAESDERQVIAEQKAIQSQQIKYKTDVIKRAIRVMEDGAPVDLDDVKQVIEFAGDLQDPELNQQLDDAISIQGELDVYRKLPPIEQENMLQSMEEKLQEGGDLFAQEKLNKRISAYKRVHAKYKRLWSDDARVAANLVGLKEDESLDYSNGVQGLIESLAARQDNNSVSVPYTGHELPILTKNESQQINAVYQNGSVTERLQLLGAIVEGAGDDQAVATLRQLDIGGASDMAFMGNLVRHGMVNQARDIMNGRAILAEKSNAGMKPRDIDHQRDLKKLTAGALKMAPDVRALYERAIVAKYVQLKAAEDDMTNDYDAGLYRQAVKEVMPTVEYNDSHVLAPVGVDQRTFDDWVDSWTDQDFADVALPEGYDALEQIKDDGVLIDIDSSRGVYGVSLISANTGLLKMVLKDDGSPLILRYPE